MKANLATYGVIGATLLNQAVANTTPSPTITTTTRPPPCPVVTSRGVCPTCILNACLEITTLTQRCDCPTPVPTLIEDYFCGGPCPSVRCGSTSYVIQQATGCSGSSTTTTTKGKCPKPTH